MRPTSIYQLPATLAVLLLFFSCLVLASSDSKDARNTLFQRDEEAGSGCSTEGQWHCMTNSFQRCAGGHWSIKMAMAEGTKCEPRDYYRGYFLFVDCSGKSLLGSGLYHDHWRFGIRLLRSGHLIEEV
ncbi:hypothetical protein DER44DRAFT_40525 [Fusarium oxysporum]|nr:hypothetical protein DER44DRAFT_40525 [Fusarium oxysporum]